MATKMRTLRVIDLFCGAGGFSEGFEQAGFEVVFAVDKWQPAVTTHHKNHPTARTILDDVERIAYLPDKEFNDLVPDAEIIIGSPPCVDFSNSNKSGKADKSLGIRLIKSFLRVVARKKYKENSVLKYWILENVANAKKYVKEYYSAEDLDLDGSFNLQVLFGSSHIYKAQHYEVPSKRTRFLCGDFPEPQILIDNESNILPLENILGSLDPVKHSKIVVDPVYHFQMGVGDVTDHYYTKLLARFEWEKAKRLKQDKGYMGKMAFPEDNTRPARTIMATLSFSARESMIFAYGKNQYRSPTIREVASLMSFPIDYRFYGKSIGIKYRLVGNAVPPKMSFAFAKAIAENENTFSPKEYRLKRFPENDTDFINLNGMQFPVKKEIPKRTTSKFKYHIPYLIEDTFRVELTNRKSDFDRNQFVWDAEIHKSQGPTADCLAPKFTLRRLPNVYREEIEDFIYTIAKSTPSAQVFQENHCQTDSVRKSENLFGPMELLSATKSFVDSLYVNGDRPIQVIAKKRTFDVPVKIAIGYFVLSEIIKRTRR